MSGRNGHPENFETRAAACIELAIETRDAGRELDLTAICGGDRELIDVVAGAIDLAPQLSTWQRALRDAGDVDPLCGRTLLERYEVEERIGAGAMGAVYRARDRELKRDVAVKILHPYLLDGAAAERFDREAEVLAAMQHPNVVAIHDRGQTPDGLRLLVMELLDGCSMATVLFAAAEREVAPGSRAFAETDWLAPGLLAEVTESNYLRLVVGWAADLASGLQAAHAAGTTHRDVKPSNVFLTRDGRALLLDFGVAARNAEQTLGAHGSTVGTPYYMAPEQVAGASEAGAALDVYGLCATLYHMLTLRPPYEGEPARVLTRLRSEDPVPAARLHPGLPRDLQAILDRGMARNPAHRYADAGRLEEDLRAFLEHRPVQARPIGGVERFVRRAWRSWTVRVAAAAVVAIAAALTVPWWLDARAAERGLAAVQARAGLPPACAIEGTPTDRRVADPRERADIAAALDRAVAVDDRGVLPRLTRAAFRLDHGDAAGAAADFAVMAAGAADPYLAGLTARYAALGAGAVGHAALDVEGLAPASTERGAIVHAFHAMRDKTIEGYRSAHEGLAPFTETSAEALELDLLARLVLGISERDRDRQRRMLTSAYDGALRLEGDLGLPTARTRHVMGAALVKLQRYDLAAAPLQSCIELWPYSHGARQNLAIVYRRQRRLADAERVLNEALQLRPDQPNTLITLSQIQYEAGRYAEALTTVARITGDGDGARRQRAEHAADVHLAHAFAAHRSGDRDVCEQQARSAEARYREALSLRKSARVGMNLDMAVGLRDGDLRAVLPGFLRKLARDPRNAVQIDLLSSLLPRQVDEELVDVLRDYLQSLAANLAPARFAPPGK